MTDAMRPARRGVPTKSVMQPPPSAWRVVTRDGSGTCVTKSAPLPAWGAHATRSEGLAQVAASDSTMAHTVMKHVASALKVVTTVIL